VDIDNDDDELVPAIALRRDAEGCDSGFIGDFHRRNAPGGNYPTASGTSDSATRDLEGRMLAPRTLLPDGVAELTRIRELLIPGHLAVA
jgi:hypothetical protein